MVANHSGACSMLNWKITVLAGCRGFVCHFGTTHIANISNAMAWEDLGLVLAMSAFAFDIEPLFSRRGQSDDGNGLFMVRFAPEGSYRSGYVSKSRWLGDLWFCTFCRCFEVSVWDIFRRAKVNAISTRHSQCHPFGFILKPFRLQDCSCNT